MSWGKFRNIQASLYDFLTEEAVIDSLTDIDDKTVTFRVGRKNSNDWEIPTISFYVESETRDRLEIGSNNRLKKYLIIFDIYASCELDRLELANWLEDTINDGWQNYIYTDNSVNPDSPIKTKDGWVGLNYLSNTRVVLGDNVAQIDAHRHRITINAWITGE